MIGFDFEKFALEKRLSRQGIADKLGVGYQTLIAMWNRGTIKPELLKKLETKLKDNLDRFIKKGS